MKQEKLVCMLAFVCGVIGVSVLESPVWLENNPLNRNSLASLSFEGIVYDEFFAKILLLRFRTLLSIWIWSKLLSKRVVELCLLWGACVVFGAIATVAVVNNGIWGILFLIGAVMPQIIFYGAAYVLWRNMRIGEFSRVKKNGNYWIILLVVIVVGIGCMCEAYINPVLVKNMVKF